MSYHSKVAPATLKLRPHTTTSFHLAALLNSARAQGGEAFEFNATSVSGTETEITVRLCACVGVLTQPRPTLKDAVDFLWSLTDEKLLN